MENNTSILKITTVGLMAAVVYTATSIKLFYLDLGPAAHPIIHLGEIVCVVSGLLLGPVFGGLSAGIGSAIFDLTNPVYFQSAPYTFILKFTMAYICGLIAHKMLKNCGDYLRCNLAATAGLAVYTILYMLKIFIIKSILKIPFELIVFAVWQSFVTTAINSVLALITAVPFANILKKALRSSGLNI